MYWVFAICAAVGVTLLLCQLAMLLLGLGGEDAADLHDLGGDFGGDVAGEVGGDVAGDVDPSGGFHDTAHLDGSNIADSHVADHPSTASVFRMLSFRTAVAAMAFFGLAGLAAMSADQPPLIATLIAVGAGLAAMYAVYRLMQWLYSLRADGTADIRRALGKHATVYVRIPGHRSGTGKVQVNVQGRTMEYLAVTADDVLPSGSGVVITQIIGPDTVAVLPDRGSQDDDENQ